ncbi:hypothetical protein [Pseudobutyrivibrio sp. AR14]|uniref:hypothetical protein n=1 Tax=Pseudobutyrivibrio sp. AR14 TaxID=1520804 RepID=UPI000B7D90D8|nr:hypothetical protein [Pseudobutyrivibrio sp. AR14]
MIIMGPSLAARSTRRSARAPQTTRCASKEGLEIGFADVYNLITERSIYMQIDSMRDLKNIVEIERTIRRIDEASQVNKGIDDYEAGRLVDGPKVLAKLRDKHGI